MFISRRTTKELYFILISMNTFKTISTLYFFILSTITLFKKYYQIFAFLKIISVIKILVCGNKIYLAKEIQSFTL